MVPAHEVILHVHVLIKHLHMKLLARQLGKNHLTGKPNYKCYRFAKRNFLFINMGKL